MVASLLDAVAVRRDEPMVHVGDEVWTGAEVEAEAERVAGDLRAAGVGPGAAVAVQLPNGMALIATLFGVWRVGAVYVPVNPRAPVRELDRVLAEVEPAAAVTVDGVERLAGTRRHDPDVALVSFTSGTTGPPKPVELRHQQVARLMDGVLDAMGFTGRGDEPPMPNLIPVSLSVWAGIYNVLFAFRVGAAVVLMDRFEPAEFARLVARHAIRSVVLPPAAMTMLADDESVAGLEPLRWVRSISAPLSPLQARRFHDRFGVGILNCWGQTELGGEVVGWSAADWRAHGETHLGAVGRPHEGVDVRTDPETGELQVHTPAMDEGRWHGTGDVGRVDDEGFVWIEGRMSDMVNRGGLKVFPAEVEEVLRLHPGVEDVAVGGVPDERLGEVPVAWVLGTAPAEELEALCREHLAPYKVPARFEPVDALPRNEAGKVLRRELRFRSGGSGARSSAQSSPQNGEIRRP